jgi:hypothetical protein
VVLLYREIGTTLSSLLVVVEAAVSLPACERMDGATTWVARLGTPVESPQRKDVLASLLSVEEGSGDCVEAASSLRGELGTRWYDLTTPAAA